MSKGNRLIIVGGAPRTGTTLMQNILDSHPLIFGGPQFRNLPDIVNLREILRKSIKIKKTDMFNSSDDIDSYIRHLIDDLLMPLLDRNNADYLSEKTPENIFVFRELMELLPEAHFIYIVRDPRAVMLSNLVVRRKFREKGIRAEFTGGKLSDFINLIHWVKKYYAAADAVTENPSKNFLTVVYDNLVTDPEKEINKICNFLELQWSSDMLHPSRKKHLGEEPITRTGIWYTPDTYNRDIDASSLNKWKKELTFFQKLIIANYFQDIKHLHKYGYDLTTDGFVQNLLFQFLSSLKRTYYRITIFRKLLKPIWNLRIFSK